MKKSAILTALLSFGMMMGLDFEVNAASTPTPQKIAYAFITGNGTLDRARSKNVVKFQGSNGLYCFKLNFKPKSVVATTAYDPSFSIFYTFIQVAVPPTSTFTCNTIPKPDSVATTYRPTLLGGTNSSEGGIPFYIQWTN